MMNKFTKIIATIGPACDSVEILEKMVKNGMNFARLNFSHGTHESHKKLVDNIRKVEKKTGQPIGIIVDLRGPRIRLGVLPEKGIKLKVGELITFDTNSDKYKNEEIPIQCEGELIESLKVGDKVLIADGKIEVLIKSIKNSKFSAEVMDDGELFSNKGLNFPDSILKIPALSEKDKKDLNFAVSQNVDFVALSFVSDAKDVLNVKYLIKETEKELKIKLKNPIQVISKIERHEAVNNIKEILDVTDAIMVARGDLGLEINASEVPLVQKDLIDKANALAKPVIVATQMLDSMQSSKRPTRAEVSDVANAVIDHADALMLSNETAAGLHPNLAVKTMSDIIMTTESSSYDNKNLPIIRKKGTDIDVAIAELSRILAEEVGAKIILAASITGETGRLISHVRPSMKIVVATKTIRVMRQLNMSWGVVPFILEPCHSIEELVERATSYIKINKIADKGEIMIIVAGEPVGQAGNVNLVEAREID